MLQLFRSFFSSKIGVAVTMGFLILIALAFAGSDVASSNGAAGFGGGDRLATVGSIRITAPEFQRKLKDGVTMLRERDPKLTMGAFVAQGGFDDVLANMIDLAAMHTFGATHGLAVGDRLIDSEIGKIPGMQGPDGRISQQNYQAFLQKRGMSDAQLRAELGDALLARELLAGATTGTDLPKAALLRYAGVVTETRSGQIAMLPSSVFAPKAAPSAADVQTWYATHRGDYTLPERRTIRYLSFTDAVLKAVPAPTEAEIAARYAAGKDKYAASENRTLTQLVLPTEAAAKAVADEVSGGRSLEAAASAKGLSAAKLTSLSQSAYAAQTDAGVAAQVFAAPRGKLLGPIKGPFGWMLVRIDSAETKAGVSAAAARSEIVAALTTEKRHAAFINYAAKIEDEIDNGAALSDVAKELGLTLNQTAALTADGAVFGKPGEKAPALLARIVPTAFQMEGERKPQVAEAEPGKTFVVFDVAAIEAAAPPPLSAIQAQVAGDLQLARGAKDALAAAQKVEAAVRGGQDLAAAMASLKLPLPPIQPVQMPRQQIQAMGAGAPVPVRALFQMAKGAVRLVGAPGNRGWFVVKATDARPGPVAPNDPRLAQFATTLGQAAGGELSEQLRIAMRQEVGVKRNDSAIAAVRSQLLAPAAAGN